MRKVLPALRDFSAVMVGFCLLGAVYLLPPDTSLSEVRANGALRACVPTSYPPLVTGQTDRPGIDVELLRTVARSIGVELVLNANEAIGKDFNPRNWDVNRAKCEVLAGGVVNTDQTRSFLDTTQAYAATGWAIVSPSAAAEIRGRRVGVLTILSGLDRIGLASHLRQQSATVTIVTKPEDLVAGIAEGRFDLGITEALLGGQIAAQQGWRVAWVPGALARYQLVFGLWKGDLTLKRAIVGAMEEMEKDGRLAAIVRRYIIAAPLDAVAAQEAQDAPINSASAR